MIQYYKYLKLIIGIFFIFTFSFFFHQTSAQIYYETSPDVQIIDSENLQKQSGFLAYGQDFRGGVNIAACDFNQDGVDEIITGAGVGGGPHIRIFDQSGEVKYEFFAFHPDFHGGIDIACGNLDQDQYQEIAVSQKSLGQAWIKVYKIKNNREYLISQFLAYNENFEGGAHVAIGDINGDEIGEILTGAGVGGGPHVLSFDKAGNSMGINFFPFPADYRGGVDVTVANVIGDKKEEIILAANKFATSRIKIYRDNNEIISDFIAYAEAYQGGVNISAGDYNHDGFSEIITVPNCNGSPFIRILDKNGNPIINSYQIYDQEFRGGFTVILGNVDKDNQVEIIAAPLSRRLKFREVIGYSVQNRPIESYIYGDGYKKIIYVGGTHAGSEANAVTLMNRWKFYIENNLDKIPFGYQVIIIPMHNPDGYCGNSRYNANGVDLNRNFATNNWSSIGYLWSRQVSGGPYPFSEVENQALKKYLEKERVEKLISYHSAADQIFASEIVPGALYPPSFEFAKFYNQFSHYNDAEESYVWTHYPISGDLSSWASQYFRIPALTVELSDGVSNDWEKNLSAMIEAIRY